MDDKQPLKYSDKSNITNIYQEVDYYKEKVIDEEDLIEKAVAFDKKNDRAKDKEAKVLVQHYGLYNA